jgi:hypothetical protein
VAVGAACSHSDAVVTVGPTNASEGGIWAAENYVTGKNKTQYLSSNTMPDNTSSTSLIIKLK